MDPGETAHRGFSPGSMLFANLAFVVFGTFKGKKVKTCNPVSNF